MLRRLKFEGSIFSTWTDCVLLFLGGSGLLLSPSLWLVSKRLLALEHLLEFTRIWKDVAGAISQHSRGVLSVWTRDGECGGIFALATAHSRRESLADQIVVERNSSQSTLVNVLIVSDSQHERGVRWQLEEGRRA